MADPSPTDSMNTVFETSPDLLFIASVDGELLSMSRSLRHSLGAERGAPLTLAALAHPDDQETLSDALTKTRNSTAPARFDLRLRNARGPYRSLSCHAARAPQGDTIHGCFWPRTVSGTSSITARLFDAMVDYLPSSVWVLDPEGRFIYNDGRLLGAIGIDRHTLTGKNILDLYGHVEGVTSHVRRSLTGEVVHYFTRFDGGAWETWLLPIRDARGDLSVVLGFNIDITSVHRAEVELRARLAEIEQQQEVIRRLSTPIIEVWDGVLTLPMLGVLDSARTADVLQSVLTHINQRGASFAILDLTGVEVVDTRVAGYLVQLISAIRLLGAEGIVAGIRPTVAQTIVALGADLTQIVTHRNLRAALSHCIAVMRDRGTTT
ncbi:PAS domain-containing protein [Chondromyces crocatus]|uniref:Anti-anti-sigma factor n=1 Tax=Chondromyces crocatus TaxID=52 RepID=A0A0K1EC18_CHOCO|nr:PAS domain-containing protein [Chondromyces crocatus]AKT38103.1 anti-anti-sigma factor [Chondromyces crocatus]